MAIVHKCPNCGNATELANNPFRPFCSERCKLIDFGRWANEEYRFPAEAVREEPEPEKPKGEDESGLSDDE